MRTVIIGGGIQGMTIALKLLDDNKLTINDLTIIDPNPYIKRWETITQRIGMDYLRSPLVHHVHPKPMHLKQYAKEEDYAQGFSGYYQKPQLEMFNNHIKDQIKAYNLDDCYIKDQAITLKKNNDLFTVIGKKNHYITDCVIIATGINHLHSVPKFMENVSAKNFSHVFEQNAAIDADTDVIIGGGITAFHLARKLSRNNRVTLIMRHNIRCHELDADPGWLGPKQMSKFDNVTDYNERRRIIKNARHRGSVPMHLKQSILNLVKQNKLNLVVQKIDKVDDSVITLANGETIPYQKIILATGCEPNLQNDTFIQNIIKTFNAPIAECGFPIVPKNLEWVPGIFVAGPLAELELGPISRNIIGGRKASMRISDAL